MVKHVRVDGRLNESFETDEGDGAVWMGCERKEKKY